MRVCVCVRWSCRAWVCVYGVLCIGVVCNPPLFAIHWNVRECCRRESMPLHDLGTGSTVAVRFVAKRGKWVKREGERNEHGEHCYHSRLLNETRTSAP